MVYKLVTTSGAEYIISAEDVELAIDLWARGTNSKPIQIRNISRYSDIREVLETCYSTAEEQLSALISAIYPVLALEADKRQDVVNTIAWDYSGISGMVKRVEKKEEADEV